MNFTKMQGCGNNYIYVDCTVNEIENPSEVSKFVSDINFGIGSDGLILIKSSKVADFKMEIYNADGSQAQMCGNGIRCVGKYVYDFGLTDKEVITVETLAGIKTLYFNIVDGKVDTVRVNMGKAITEPDKIPAKCQGKDIILNEAINVQGKEYKVTAVSMGNPHCITFVDDVKAINLEKIGPDFENHPMFPERVNTEFIHVVDEENIDMRVWERGSGETWACGTGACASVVACVLNGLTKRDVTVHLTGGDLRIKYSEDGEVEMTGPARVICQGTIEI